MGVKWYYMFYLLKTDAMMGYYQLFLTRIDLRDDPKTLARLNDMKEKPICGARTETSKRGNATFTEFKNKCKTVEVVIEAEIYRAFTVCQALCRVFYMHSDHFILASASVRSMDQLLWRRNQRQGNVR